MRGITVVAGLALILGLVAVVVVANAEVGWGRLGTMVAALLGLVGLLAVYNRRYR